MMKSDIELDNKLIEYCNNNPDEYNCQCIFPTNKKITNLYSKYYCWWGPCLDVNTFKTSLIESERNICNNTLCVISMDDITITDGNILVNNECIRNSNTVLDQSQKINFIPYYLPDMLINISVPIIIGIFLIILF